MKKIFAMLLCLALMLGAAAAPAETAAPEKTQMGTVSMRGAFRLQCALPDGYALVTVQTDEGRYIGMVSPMDDAEGKPVITVSIAFNELLAEVERMNDLDEDAMALIEASFTEDDTVVISYLETAYGTKILVARDAAEICSYVDFYSVYKGYEVEIVMTAPENSDAGITDAQVEMAMSFISELDFVTEP